MKYVIVLLCLWIQGISLVSANTQNQFSASCGDLNGFSVVYAHVDNMGIAPRPLPGSEDRFNCIAAVDPHFQSQRFDSSWKALNYWFVLFSQATGVNLQPLPAPTQ